MKKILFSIALFSIAIASRAQTTQVVDLSTGVVNGTGAAAAVCSVDDTWTYSWQGYPYLNLLVSNGDFDYVNPSGVHVPAHAVKASCASWISPVVNTAAGTYHGMMNNANVGAYSYKMTFNSKNCTPLSATLNINDIAADNIIDTILINGVPHDVTPYSVDFSSLKTFSLPVATSEIIPGTNTVIVRVHNSSSFSGMFLCGNLTINYATDPNLIPSFTGGSTFCAGDALTFTGSDGPSTAVNYVWTVVESNMYGTPVTGATEWWSPWFTGSPGTYTLPTTGGPTLTCGKYYRVKLAVQNDCVNWAETAHTIKINCLPVANAGADQNICPGTCATLSCSLGRSNSYSWTMDDDGGTNVGNTSTITVCPEATTMFCCKVFNSVTGCSATDCMVVNVLPNYFTMNVSTGYDNASNTLSTLGGPDDQWIGVSIPSNATFNTPATCIDGTFHGTGWALNPSGTGTWITTDATGDLPHNQLYAGSGHYIYEYHFTLPSTYGWYTLTVNKFAADNDATLYLDGVSIAALNPSASSTNYTVGITSPVTVSLAAGAHILKSDVIEYDRYTGMFLNGFVSGTCGKSMPITNASAAEDNAGANISVYPNPGTGVFTVELNNASKTSIEVYDALGKKVKALESNGFKSTIDLTGFPKGIYMINIISEGKLTSKKIILE